METLKEVCRVCFPERESPAVLRDEWSEARREWLGGKRPVRVGKRNAAKGFEGRLSGRLGLRGCHWKKQAGKAVLEEVFERTDGYVMVCRDYEGTVRSRTRYGKDMLWSASAYYDPWDSEHARVIFQPDPEGEQVLRLDRQDDGRYRQTVLSLLPYRAGAVEQSLVSARFGEPELILALTEGELCACPKEEAALRRAALEEVEDGTVVLMPAWEVREGVLAADGEEDGEGPDFLSLEEYARTEEDAPEAEAGEETPPADPEEDWVELKVSEQKEREPEELEKIADEIMEEADRSGEREEEPQESALALPEENLSEDLQAPDGFALRYDRNGGLSYAGFWKDEKKEGLGVSFRSSDHALHVSRWENGKPGSVATLFDPQGSLRYSGRIVNGRKEGAGVTVSREDGSVFVGQWKDGEPTGFGSAFDPEGNLLYTGQWKDGKRHGRGTEFDGSGGVVFDGEWRDGKYFNGILYRKLNAGGETEKRDPD